MRQSGNTANKACKGSEKVQAFLDELVHPHKPGILALRRLILSLDERVREDIKWNAPSFLLEDHFATFKLHPPTSIQLVLHRGAKVRDDGKKLDIPDPQGLLKWAAADRCVLTLSGEQELEACQTSIADILRHWIRQL